MTGTIWPWLSAGLAVIGIMSLMLALLTRRGSSPTDTSAVPAPAQPWGGPIARLDFNQSLDPDVFARTAEEEALSFAQLQLRDLFADGAVITLQSLRAWSAAAEMVVGASAQATEALRSGAAVLQKHGSSARLLPHVTDSRSGQILEVM